MVSWDQLGPKNCTSRGQPSSTDQRETALPIMPRCPRCAKVFKSTSRVLQHMNHPRSTCVGFADDLVDIPNPAGEPNSPYDSDQLEFEDSMDIIMEESESVAQEYTHHTSSAAPNCRLNDQGYHVEEFGGAAKVHGTGSTFMDKFDKDQYAKNRRSNLYFPFASKQEWDLAAFLLRSPLSISDVDKFLSLELVSFTSYLDNDAHNLSDSILETVIFNCQRTSQSSRDTSCRSKMEMLASENSIPYESTCSPLLSRPS